MWSCLRGSFTCYGRSQVAAEETTKSNSTTNVAVTTTGNPATNLPEAQGSASKEAEQSQNQAGETNGSIPVEVPKTDLDQAAKEAKSAGVNVVRKMPMLIKERSNSWTSSPKRN